MALVLVDTSVWIRAEKGLVVSDHVAIQDLAICPVVVSEVLRGTRDQRHYEKSRTFLLLMQMLDAPTSFERFEEAAVPYLACRAAGITIASVDCLIAATAIAHDAALMHDDADFDLIAKATPLKIYDWARA